jgi:carbon-monoxide dehydrogenase small subunit
MSRLQMTVNGKPVDLDVPESRYLSEVLRKDLQLTGTKIGCNEAECGICSVLVDGTPVVSCVYPAFKANGARVETIESLSRDGELHALQQAFLDHGAVQCGICTPGVIMTAKGLIDEKAAAGEQLTEEHIAVALKFCRHPVRTRRRLFLFRSTLDIRSANRCPISRPGTRLRARLALLTTINSRACCMRARSEQIFHTQESSRLKRQQHAPLRARSEQIFHTQESSRLKRQQHAPWRVYMP